MTNLPVAVYNQLDRGSDRGSGYWQTNAILRYNDKVFITWQSPETRPRSRLRRHRCSR